MAGRLIGKGSANSSTVASPSASRRTIERRVGSDKAAKTTSNRSGAVTGIFALPPSDTSQTRYLTDYVSTVKATIEGERPVGSGGRGFQHGHPSVVFDDSVQVQAGGGQEGVELLQRALSPAC